MTQADKNAPSKIKFLEVSVMNNGNIGFAFGNNEKRVFETAKCSDEIKRLAMLHGFNQKIRDASAGFSKEDDYAGALEAIDGVIETLYSGAWNKQGGGNSGATKEDLIQAIAKVKKADVEKVRAAVEKASDEKRKEWSKNAKIVEAIAEIKVARAKAAAKVATEELDIKFDE